MFTKLLTPLLISTAKISSPSSVRVVWVSSSAAEGLSPKGGVDMQNLDYKVEKLGMTKLELAKQETTCTPRSSQRGIEKKG
jgi:retinol dehydrogenase 12